MAIGNNLNVERLEDFSADLVFVEVDQVVEISDETAQVVGDVGVGLRFRDYFDVGACVEVAAADLHCRQGNLQKIKTEKKVKQVLKSNEHTSKPLPAKLIRRSLPRKAKNK